MRKTKLLLASLFFLLLGIAFSCKVDIENLDEPIVSGDLLSKIRQSFEQKSKTDAFLKTANIDPAWNNAIVFGNSIELSYGENGIIHRPSLTDNNENPGRERLILTQKNGKLKSTIIRYLPSKKFKGKINEINSRNLKSKHFDGKVVTQTMGSKKVKFYYFADGKLYKQYKGKIVRTSKNGRIAACHEEDYWDCSTKYDEHGEWYMDCTHTWIQVCDDEDDNDDEEDEDPCVTFPEYCDDPCLMDPGSCGGGDGGGSSGSNRVDNLLTDPCFSNTLQGLMNHNWRLTATDILANFNSSTSLNLTVSNTSFGNTSVDADHAHGNATTYQITLNDDALVGASQEYIAATIMHESIHALLFSQGKRGELQNHIEMVNSYINPMADALRFSFLMSREDAVALAWGGLGDTSAWQALTQAQQQNIININSSHKNLNGNHQNAPGTHCN